MIGLCAVGALFGASICLLVWALVPRRASAIVQLAHLEQAWASSPPPGPPAAQLRRRAQVALLGWLGGHGVTFTSLRQDLALTGDSLETVMGRKLLGALGGFLAGAAAGAGLPALLGVSLPLISPAVLAVGAGAGMWFLPTLTARREAAARRRDFRETLSGYVVLVALQMGANAAPGQALSAAATGGDSWEMTLLRVTLQRGARSDLQQWQVLTDLGEQIGVPELIDLATTIRHAAAGGADVRRTLITRAATMRHHALAEAIGQAGQRYQSMLLAQIVVGAGFILLVMVPGVVSVFVL